MIPLVLLDSAKIPDGKELCLYQHDKDYIIKVGNVELMNSRTHGSEDALAELTCKAMPEDPRPRLLLGGLGMGFSLRAALDHLPSRARVVVSELAPAVVKWNRGRLGPLAGKPLEDKRVQVHEVDVMELIRGGRGQYSAIILDVDNGPRGLLRDSNNRLYSFKGLYAIREALGQDGVLSIWSAGPDDDFVKALKKAGFEVEQVRVRARAGNKGGAHHIVWLARKTNKPDFTPKKKGKPKRFRPKRR